MRTKDRHQNWPLRSLALSFNIPCLADVKIGSMIQYMVRRRHYTKIICKVHPCQVALHQRSRGCCRFSRCSLLALFLSFLPFLAIIVWLPHSKSWHWKIMNSFFLWAVHIFTYFHHSIKTVIWPRTAITECSL